MIEYWAHLVGCDELIVRDYDHLHNGAIFDDFSLAIGLPAVIDMRTGEVTGKVVRIDPAAQGGTVRVDVAFQGKLPEGENVIIYGLETPFTEPHDYLFNMYHPRGTRNHAAVNDGGAKGGALADDFGDGHRCPTPVVV